jgi:hypothetical protein
MANSLALGDTMLTYTNQRLQKAAMGYAGAALISGGVFGSVTLILSLPPFVRPQMGVNSLINVWLPHKPCYT